MKVSMILGAACVIAFAVIAVRRHAPDLRRAARSLRAAREAAAVARDLDAEYEQLTAAEEAGGAP